MIKGRGRVKEKTRVKVRTIKAKEKTVRIRGREKIRTGKKARIRMERRVEAILLTPMMTEKSPGRVGAGVETPILLLHGRF